VVDPVLDAGQERLVGVREVRHQVDFPHGVEGRHRLRVEQHVLPLDDVGRELSDHDLLPFGPADQAITDHDDVVDARARLAQVDVVRQIVGSLIHGRDHVPVFRLGRGFQIPPAAHVLGQSRIDAAQDVVEARSHLPDVLLFADQADMEEIHPDQADLAELHLRIFLQPVDPVELPDQGLREEGLTGELAVTVAEHECPGRLAGLPGRPLLRQPVGVDFEPIRVVGCLHGSPRSETSGAVASRRAGSCARRRSE
jgi:hypothetical protein